MLWEALLPPSEMGNPARMITGVDGYELTFADGNQAICLTSGLWNVNFGYGTGLLRDHIDQVCSQLHYATLFVIHIRMLTGCRADASKSWVAEVLSYFLPVGQP